MSNKLDPMIAAQKFVEEHFQGCEGALLAGSVVRGEATSTSDLDLVIFGRHLESSYRESLIKYDWNIEVFAHNLQSYKTYFESDCKRARPSLPRMVVEGVVLKDNGVIPGIKSEAASLLNKGPEPWPKETIDFKRYFITDVLDDLIGCQNRAEGIFITNELANLLSEFVLRTNNQWVGNSKWIIRSLRQFDHKLAERFVVALDQYYKSENKGPLVQLTDKILKPYGGRLFAGFSLGKN
ncbi:nucleotidyltransferase domain-containing protein [Alkalibacillus haloalkaliphilus]|uniref:Nucleotidyltransferase n=1 Tax=Alkalibacillus haloalkaliphilus TaxID=94136 RepID=A0A511W3R9_9BACI|nr:nucleotidyltransferase domain-containing protein [Alkalibacillus haloalkaliphilus]GEN45720.1 nucleotidyltransferase [Alkalibacillus haloalkaliphilus]